MYLDERCGNIVQVKQARATPFTTMLRRSKHSIWTARISSSLAPVVVKCSIILEALCGCAQDHGSRRTTRTYDLRIPYVIHRALQIAALGWSELRPQRCRTSRHGLGHSRAL
jgi:hypothetical protein